MYVTIQLQPEAALALQGRRRATTASRELLKTAWDLDVTLKPMHPDTDDPKLASYFVVELPDAATAERVIARLQNCKAIKAAYMKPPDELP